MSALFEGVPQRDAAGRIICTDAITVPDHFHNGLPYELDGTLCIDTTQAIDHYHQLLPFTPEGRICVVMEGTTDRVQNCTPVGLAGFVNMSLVDPISHYANGVAFSAAQRVCRS